MMLTFKMKALVRFVWSGCLILVASSTVYGGLTVFPSNTTTQIGNRVELKCSTDFRNYTVDWSYVPAGKTDLTNIYIRKRLVTGEVKFDMFEDYVSGMYNLLILSSEKRHAGKYACTDRDGLGEKRWAELIILESAPQCNDNISTDGVAVVDDSCGIQPDVVHLSCNISYSGNIAPVLDWLQTETNDIITTTSNDVIKSDVDTTIPGFTSYDLVVRANKNMNGNSFVCRVRDMFKQNLNYRCNTSSINILNSFSSPIKLKTCESNQMLTCSANTNQPCNYFWVNTSSGNIVSRGKTLHFSNPQIAQGEYKCQAECSIRGKTCPVTPLSVNFDCNDQPTQAFHASHVTGFAVFLALFLFFLLLLLVCLIIGCFRYKRKLWPFARRVEKNGDIELKERKTLLGSEKEVLEAKSEKAESPPEHNNASDQNRSNAEDDKGDPTPVEIGRISDGGDQIIGFTVIHSKIYIARSEMNEIDVYDANSFIREDTSIITVEKLGSPLDITSCSHHNCLYISDFNSDIHRVSLSPPIGMSQWKVKSGPPDALSVTNKFNVLVVCFDNHIREYTTDGKLLNTVSMEASIEKPWHCVLIANGKLLVAHGNTIDKVNRVCMVDPINGSVCNSYGSGPGSDEGQLHKPRHLAVDSNSCVLVADSKNNRIVLLDSTLQCDNKVLIPAEFGLNEPHKIFLDEKNFRLYAAEGVSSDGKILIYKLKFNLEKYLLLEN